MSEHTPRHEVSRRTEQHATHQESIAHHERIERHRETAAKHVEKHPASHEELQKDIEAQAISGAEYHSPQAEHRQPAMPITKVDKEHGFETIMHQVRNDMKPSERTFSKFIHQPVVEKTSELAGKTIARPSGVIGATVAAFIGLLSVYGIAKFAGFGLSGSEAPLLLAIGFAVGLFIEWFLKSMRAVFGKK